MTRVGVVGVGLMGSIHARLLGTSLVAVADPDRAAAEQLGVQVYDDGLELIAADDVDAVVVASPVFTHEPLVLACIAAGKPVLCEKPLTATPEAARRIVEAERAAGRRLVSVGFMRRFDPGYVDLKARLDRGDIGRPLLVHCAHRNPFVHAFFDSAMIIILRGLLGEEITAVDVRLSRASARAREGLQDPQLILLRTASGVLADVEAFVSAGYGYDIRCEIVGEDGTLALPVDVRRGFAERFAAAYGHELRAWLAGEDVAGAADGFAAAAICAAGVESLRRGGEVPVRIG